MLSRIRSGAGGFAITLNTFLCLALSAPASLAAPNEEETAETSAEAEATESATEEAAAAEEAAVEPAAAEPVPEPESLPEPEKPLFIFYGILKPELITSNGVETFGKPTMVAPTAAAHPIADPKHDEWALSFQLQQTRVGVKIGEGRPLGGRLEIDFVDPVFSLASPIQATRPRLRLAYVTYKPATGHTLTVGQNWDIFSPLNPTTNNLVGALFEAGNAAFLRPQVTYTYGTGEGMEVSAAVGMRAQNTAQAMTSMEFGLIPSLALQVGYKKGKNWYGVSGIVTAEMTEVAGVKYYNAAAAGNIFANLALADWLSLTVEGYFARNGNALGLLTLSSGTFVMDAGGYASANVKLGKMHALWISGGAAFVLNTVDLALGYTAATATAPAARVGAGGIESNISARAAYVLSPLDGLQFYLEPFLFATRHKLALTEDPTGTLANQLAIGGQLGTRYNF